MKQPSNNSTKLYLVFKNILLNLFARIWAVWGLISFVVTFLIILIPSLITSIIPDPKGMHYFYQLSNLWMRTWFFLVRCKIEIKGTEYFQQGQSYIVTCNHNSLLDIPLSSPFIPGANKTIAKKTFTKVPLFGWYYSRGSVVVDRSDSNSRRKSFDLMKAALDKGLHMCIYPEGTRNRTDQPLKSFYDGAFRLAVNTNHAIIPAVILNTGKALPVNKFFYFLPAKLSLHFLPPVYPENFNTTEIKEQVFNLMKDYYTEHSTVR